LIYIMLLIFLSVLLTIEDFIESFLLLSLNYYSQIKVFECVVCRLKIIEKLFHIYSYNH